MRMQLLGRCVLLGSDGVPLKIGGRKDLALLALLAMDTRHAHSRDKLAQTLWGGRGRENARHSLRQSLVALRRACPDTIRSVGDSVFVDRQLLVSDAELFLRAIESAETDALETAISLYRGEFMDGLVIGEALFDEWQEQIGQFLLERFRVAVAELMKRYRMTGDNERAIAVGRRAIEVDPFDELAHQRTMEALVAAGRRREALALFASLRRRLRTELGVQPNAEIAGLAGSLGNHGGQDRQPATGLKPSDFDLVEAFESLDAFVVYDRDDRFVACNAKFRSTFSRYADLFVPGTRFDEILRAMVTSGEFPEARTLPLSWIRSRLERHRRGINTPDLLLRDGRRLFLSQRLTRDGYIVVVFTDVSE